MKLTNCEICKRMKEILRSLRWHYLALDDWNHVMLKSIFHDKKFQNLQEPENQILHSLNKEHFILEWFSQIHLLTTEKNCKRHCSQIDRNLIRKMFIDNISDKASDMQMLSWKRSAVQTFVNFLQIGTCN